jgi:pyruvate dehydrogenase E2 component (dihydrolipoamide acetyltransferase)
MDYNIVMPQLSDSMEEGRLVSWKVKPGDRVKQGDVIAEVESDKAIMEVQTFKEGIVKELKIEEGETAPVGAVIAVIGVGDSGGVGGSGGERELSTIDHRLSTGNSNDQRPTTSPSAKETNDEQRKSKNERRTTNDEPSILDEIFHTGPASPSSSVRPEVAGEASPAARALAAKLGIDIERLQKEGRLPKPAHEEDVRAYYLRRYFTPKALELIEAYGLSTDLFEANRKHTEKDVLAYVEAHDIPLPKKMSPMRQAIVKTVTDAAKKPVFHIYDAIDATLLKKNESHRHTVTVWLIKLIGEAMMRHEELRTTLAPGGLQVWPGASISVAMAHEEALYMPVFKDVQSKNVDAVADELAKLRERVRAGRVEPEALRGSTFGLSNLGMTGIERFDAMINGNDCGIAAIGAEKDGTIAVTLTLDHRIVNGWQGAEFMQTLKTLARDVNFFKKARE